ncbi:MAG: hypothetical protein ABIJ96_00605 [Elusimicrobiota bacterium]
MKNFLVLTLSLLLTAPAYAQWASLNAPIGESAPSAPQEKGGSEFDFSLGGNFGAASVLNPRTGKMEIYNTISFQPELSFGKLGLGLDLYIYFDADGKLRDEDWDTTSDIISKIWYVRWAQKGDPIHARLGGLSGTTIGHGLIMGNYSNRLGYPDVRKVGGVLDVDAGWAGFESVVTDVIRPTIIGGRVFARPLYGSDIPLLKNLSFAASAVTDTDPDGFSQTKSDEVSVYGVDLDLPLLKNDAFSSVLYADAAMMQLGKRYTAAGSKNHGKGAAAGVQGKVLFFDYKAEMRSTQANFIPTFFDSYYEVDRATGSIRKADGIVTTANPQANGPLVSLYANILERVRVGGSYESLSYDPLDIFPRVRAEIRTDPRLLFDRFYVAAAYEQRNLEMIKRIGRTQDSNTLITAEIGYKPNPNLALVVVQKQTYDRSGRPERTTQVRADVRF